MPNNFDRESVKEYFDGKEVGYADSISGIFHGHSPWTPWPEPVACPVVHITSDPIAIPDLGQGLMWNSIYVSSPITMPGSETPCIVTEAWIYSCEEGLHQTGVLAYPPPVATIRRHCYISFYIIWCLPTIVIMFILIVPALLPTPPHPCQILPWPQCPPYCHIWSRP